MPEDHLERALQRESIAGLRYVPWLEIWDSEGKDSTFNQVLVWGYCSVVVRKSTTMTITMDGCGISMNIICCSNLFVDFVYILSLFLILVGPWYSPTWTPRSWRPVGKGAMANVGGGSLVIQEGKVTDIK